MTTNETLLDAEYKAECAESTYRAATMVLDSLDEAIGALYELREVLSLCAESYNADGAIEIETVAEVATAQLLNAKTEWIGSLLY